METAGQTVTPGRLMADSGKPLICPTCGDHFLQSQALQQHQRVHAGQRQLPEMMFTRTAAARSPQPTNRARFSVCDVCGKGFTLPGLLARHQATHTGNEPLACERCGQFFALAANHTRHRLTHCQGRALCCSLCQAGFGDQRQLELHRRRHALQFSFVCRRCGQGFSRSHILDRHARLHEAETPPAAASPRGPGPTAAAGGASPPSICTPSSSFICHLCGDSFARWDSLQQHRCPMPVPAAVAKEGERAPARSPDNSTRARGALPAD